MMHCVVAVPSCSVGTRGVTPPVPVMFGAVPVGIGLAELREPVFDPAATPQHVLVQVSAFSCNFRDKSLLLSAYAEAGAHPGRVVPFGSEFCGRVVAVGDDVTGFAPGDRVMADCAYPAAPEPGVAPGVPSNIASMGWLRVHRSKLTPVPDAMDDVQAASFVLGAQTAAGMIRRSGILDEGGRPVVMSARSATSIFIVQQLRDLGLEPLCLSTSPWSQAELDAAGVPAVRSLGEDLTLSEAEELGVTHVFDPFFDMNLLAATQLLQPGGTYITCGLRDQHPELSTGSVEQTGTELRAALSNAIVKNLTLRGNCLGSTDDLRRVLSAYRSDSLGPLVDGVFAPQDAGAFVQRTFFDKRRFGKCVMLYPDAA